MAEIPQTLPTPAPSAVASYSWSDIGSRTGMIMYHLFDTEDDSATDYHLITSSVYPRNIYTWHSGVGAPGLDLDFDL